ncbi:hypothetical protein F4V89_27925 [Neorhizobium galegae]|nr:hypothetical protein F4V89_27925 [Neorhizobium galegae]
MPRYYFHLRKDGVLEEDPEGTEFATLDAAEEDAVQAVREIVADKVLADDIIEDDRFEIATADGTVLSEVRFKSVLRLQ